MVLDPNAPGVVHRGDSTFYPTGPVGPDDVVIALDQNGKAPGGASLDTIKQSVVNKRVSARWDAALTSSAQATTASAATVTPMASCGGVSYAAAPYVWSAPYSYCMGVIGTSSSTRVGYSFMVEPETNQEATAQGEGWYQGYNGSDFGYWSAWYGLGVATSNSNSGGSVPWGISAATPRFRAYSMVPHAAIGYWYAG